MLRPVPRVLLVGVHQRVGWVQKRLVFLGHESVPIVVSASSGVTEIRSLVPHTTECQMQLYERHGVPSSMPEYAPNLAPCLRITPSKLRGRGLMAIQVHERGDRLIP